MTLADLVGRICAGLIQQTIFLMVGLVVSQPLSAAPQDGPEFHGRLMIDFPGLDTPGDDPRSLHLKISGKLPAGINWKAQFEAGSFELDFKEFYLDGALGNHARARAGQFCEPMGLDGQTSLEVIPFPERSAPTQAFTQGRNMGVMFYGGQGTHWGLGVFANSSEAFDTPGSERAISARLYGAPQDGSKGLLHLGLAASFRDGHSTGLQFSARPGTHGSLQMIDTGLLPDARAATLTLELAHASGQWTTVAEVMASSVQLPQKNGLAIGGAQVSAVYSFDDERSRWEPERDRWGRAQPAVDEVWIEWATRIAFTDLDNGTLEGGAQFDWGSGLSLHFTSRSRLMLHYQRSERIGAGDGLDQAANPGSDGVLGTKPCFFATG